MVIEENHKNLKTSCPVNVPVGKRRNFLTEQNWVRVFTKNLSLKQKFALYEKVEEQMQHQFLWFTCHSNVSRTGSRMLSNSYTQVLLKVSNLNCYLANAFIKTLVPNHLEYRIQAYTRNGPRKSSDATQQTHSMSSHST